METQLATRFGSGTKEGFAYALAVVADAPVQAQMWAEQQYYADRYQLAPGFTDGRLILVQFMAREEMEGTLIRWMHRIISLQQRFPVSLQLGSGAAGSALQLRVANSSRFQQLADELKIVDPYLESNGCARIKPVLHPQLALTGTLAAAAYHEALADATHRRFEISFEVSTLVLLRRQHEFATCKQVNLFGLQL